jgi:transcriptional regulator with XRE-family HTH domain
MNRGNLSEYQERNEAPRDPLNGGTRNGHSDEIARFGTTMRQSRHSKKMTLEEMAERTGLSVGLLSQLERGIGNPSFMTLVKIADALGTPLSHFFFEREEIGTVVRRDDRKRMSFSQPGITIELLTPPWSRPLQALWVRYDAGLRTEEAPFCHEGEEIVILVRGTLELHLGDEVFMLNVGDAITFACSTPHWYYNPGPEAAEIFSAMTQPAF